MPRSENFGTNDPYGRIAGCGKLQQKTLGLDIYRTPFLFLLPDHKE